ncbi:hypothetical protein ACFOSW_33400 [Paenibacillus sp. GCM10012303]
MDRIEAGFIDEVIPHAKQPPRQDAAGGLAMEERQAALPWIGGKGFLCWN